MMKILLGADFSRDSKTAIRFLSGIRFPPNSELFLLHVTSGYEGLRVRHSYELDEGLRSFHEKTLERAHRNLDKLGEKFVDSRLTVHPIVKEGNSGKEILSLLEREQIDLAVLGTRGLSGIQRFLLGSVSEWVLQEAPCPVLVVRGSTNWINRGIRVLLTTDGSTEAEAALEFLNNLRFPSESEIFLFHVVEPTDYTVVQDDQRRLSLDPSSLAKVSADIQNRVDVASRSLLKQAKKGLTNRHSKIEHISAGYAAEEIIKAARRFRANLIVMGSRGLTGIKRQFLGSVSARVTRHAPCSVLVVRQSPKTRRVRL